MKNSKPKVKKPPVIRRGNKKPFVKHTPQEIEKRVDDVETLLGRRARKSQIHEIICKKYNVDWRTVDLDIGRARARLLQRLNETKNEHKSKALALYEQILLTGNPREKILAQERIDKLLGLEAPRQIGIGGGDGMPPVQTVVKDVTERPLKGYSKDDLKAIIALAQKK